VDYNVNSVDPDGNHTYNCSKCQENYYLDITGNNNLGECIEGTILNCKEYIFDKNECFKCQFGFYLSNPITCESSNLKNISSNCLETDSTQPDTCLKCKDNFILLERVEECELADKFKTNLNIETNQCLGWSDPTTCSDCAPMFYGTTCQHETG
jgi:hypothetical protein